MESQARWTVEIFQKLELLYARSTGSQNAVSIEVNTLCTKVLYPLLESMSADGGTDMLTDGGDAASSSQV